MEKGQTQSQHFWFNFDPLFPLKMSEIEINKQWYRKTSAKHVKIKALSPLPFPGKIWLLFSISVLFLQGNREGSQVRRLESKFGKSYFIHIIPGQFPVKKLLIPTFSSYVATDHKGHFRKVLTWILKFGYFSWYHSYIFESNKLNFLMQNLQVNRLAPISNPKNEKAKSS